MMSRSSAPASTTLPFAVRGRAASGPAPRTPPPCASPAAARAAASAAARAEAEAHAARARRPQRARRPSARVLAGAGYLPMLVLALLAVASALAINAGEPTGVGVGGFPASQYGGRVGAHSLAAHGNLRHRSDGMEEWQLAHAADGGDDHRPFESRHRRTATPRLAQLGGHPLQTATLGDDGLPHARRARAVYGGAAGRRREDRLRKENEGRCQVVEYEWPGVACKYVGAEKMTAG